MSGQFVAPASFCNAMQKRSLYSFYPLLQIWDFPGELQQWVWVPVLVLQKEQSPLLSTVLQHSDRRQKSLSCDVQAWFPREEKEVCVLGQFPGNGMEERGRIMRYH